MGLGMGEDILELDAERLEDFIDRYLELDRRAQQPYGVFSVLSGRREKKYQQTSSTSWIRTSPTASSTRFWTYS